MAKARKEIDKDAMYQKIMPSSVRESAAEEAAAPAVEKKPTAPRPRKSSRAVSITSRPSAHAPVTVMLEDQPAEPTHPAYEPTPDAAPPTRAVKPAEAENSSVINIMERLIDAKIDVAMDKFHCCTCDSCRRDITAYALNRLAPRYIVQDPESIAEAMADKESNTQVTTALVQAILKVKANPKH